MISWRVFLSLGMTSEQLELLKYPIGKFDFPEHSAFSYQKDWIADIEKFPDKLQKLVKNLNVEHLNTAYRPDGWTVRQVIHHLADSHTHAYIRFKWALTEVNPLIKVYNEKLHAELPDSIAAPIQLSLDYLKALHAKWTYLLKLLEEKDFQKSFIHPVHNSKFSLLKALAMYSWHGRHHYAHIEHLLKRKDWM